MRAHVFGRSFVLLGFLLCPLAAQAQLVDAFQPIKANCCLRGTAQQLADQLADWNQLSRYHADNERLKALPPDAGRVVFLGDSITDGWDLAKSFPGKPYVNRGIGGQTTPQMLVRTFPDVINLRPAAVVILAGTNDISANTGPSTLRMIQQNIQAICELSERHGIKVIIATLLPVSDYTGTKQTVRRPFSDIKGVNAWVRDYVKQSRLGLADYYSALVDERGMLREGYSNDGVHPNAEGYSLMAPIAEAEIKKALR